MSQSLYGLVYRTREGSNRCPQLRSAVVHASVVDSTATVTFTQTFLPLPSEHLGLLYYIFPVPAHTTVHEFSIHGEDGRSIIAVVKERNEDAIVQSNGRLDFASGNAFVMCLGQTNISQTLQVRLRYVCELLYDEQHRGIRIEIPAVIGSSCSDGSNDAYEPSTTLQVITRIQMPRAIVNVWSVNHPGDTQLMAEPRDDGTTTTGLTARYHSTKSLNQDFVLIIQIASAADVSYCFAERNPNDSNSVSMRLTFIPNFSSFSAGDHEYIFVVDRSGSMEGAPIARAKDTLAMLLHSLPKDGTRFNVFSFGSTRHALFPLSRVYGADTQSKAIDLISQMDANMGGTAMYAALQAVFNSRASHMPTAVFVLTDGEPNDKTPDEIFSLVSHAVATTSPDTPLRVFALGIGHGSPNMEAVCRGIAQAGNGICSMATDIDHIMSECAKLLRVGQTFVLKNVVIDWGVSQDVHYQGSSIQQVPAMVHDIYPGSRLSAFALIHDSHYTIPEHVVVKGRKNGLGGYLEFPVPVILVQWTDWMKPPFPLLHTLAARHIINDCHADNAGNTEIFETYRQTIVKLAEQYQLATSFTMFVPVEKFEKVPSTKKTRSSSSNSRSRSRFRFTPIKRANRPVTSNSRATDTQMAQGQHSTGSAGGSPPLEPSTSTSTNTSPTVIRTFSNTNQREAPSSSERPFPVQGLALSNVHGTSAQVSSSFASSRLHSGDVESNILASPGSNHLPMVRYIPDLTDIPEPSPVESITLPPPNDVQRLVLLQAFDGYWESNPEFNSIVGDHPFDHDTHTLSDSRLWPTALAVTYLKNYIRDHPAILDGSLSKGLNFGYVSAKTSDDDFDKLLHLADIAINGVDPDVIPMTIIKAEEPVDVDVHIDAPIKQSNGRNSRGSTFWLRGCVFVSLLVTFVLLFLVAVSASILNDVAIAIIKVSSSSEDELRFGVWGVCAEGQLDVPAVLTKQNGTCSFPRSGYTVPTQLFTAFGHPELADILPHRLISMLTLHPACVGLAFIATFLSLVITTRRMAIGSLVLVGLATVVGSIAFAADVAVVIVMRNRVASVQPKGGTGEGVNVHAGNALWLMLTAVILLWGSLSTLSGLIFHKFR